MSNTLYNSSIFFICYSGLPHSCCWVYCLLAAYCFFWIIYILIRYSSPTEYTWLLFPATASSVICSILLSPWSRIIACHLISAWRSIMRPQLYRIPGFRSWSSSSWPSGTRAISSSPVSRSWMTGGRTRPTRTSSSWPASPTHPGKCPEVI